MNDRITSAFSNHIRMALIVAVDSQVTLLTILHKEGLLREVSE